MTSLRQLHYFVTVAEEGQLTRAAQRLHLSQPALSQAVAQLEAQLGVELLERHARGVGLTGAGEAFFEKARAAVAALAEVDLAADSLSRAARHSFECGFVGTAPTVEAPQLFERFSLAYPDVEIGFRELSFPCGTMSAWLEEVDVALCFAPTADGEVEAQVMREEPHHVVMSSSHPLADRETLTVADILEETFCGTHPACEPVRIGYWRLDGYRGRAARITADRAINPQEVIGVVASGRAIWTAAASSAKKLLSLPGLAAAPLDDVPPVPFALVWHSANHNPQVAALARLAGASANGVGAAG
jgi:DNA-binding transcriptional LysR family regulator